MPFTNTWIGTTGDYELSTNWQKISARTAAWSWTASGSGTNEYYLRTAANGNPGFQAQPALVYLNGTSATEATVGSLAVGQWDYADNDALGYSTLYVRVTGGVDPDTLDADYVEFRQIPRATENVRIPAGSGTISSNLDQSAVAIEGFYVEEGYDGTIGSATGYLRIDPNVFEFDSLGQAYIDVHSANINCIVKNTGNGDEGEYGLNLRGSNIATIDARAGSLGIAPLPGETTTVSTLKVAGKSTVVKVGSGVTLSAVSPMFDGTVHLFATVTTVTKYGGNVYLHEACAVTTVNDYGIGEFHWGSSGNITTYNARGSGMFNMRASSSARTLTTLNIYSTTSGRIIMNREQVTITNHTINESVVVSYSAT
jgi:hypothetical protein